MDSAFGSAARGAGIGDCRDADFNPAEGVCMTIDHIYEEIDGLVTSDVAGRGVIGGLYGAARASTKIPVALSAAQRVRKAVKEGDTVFITTGFLIPPKGIQETDGPPGAVALARILSLIFKARVIIITEETAGKILVAALHGIGMTVVEPWNLHKKGIAHAAAVMGFPLEPKEAEREARTLLDEYDPSLVLAIEKAGRNRKGECHTMHGLNVSSLHAVVEPLIKEARARGILTVGIGDGGNEVGMGNIKNTVERLVPYAKRCRCPCGGGIAAVSRVDSLVTASISNWGAYGIEACLARLTGKQRMFHTPRLEESVLRHVMAAGAIDGANGRNEFSVDGVSGELQMAMVDTLGSLISKRPSPA